MSKCTDNNINISSSTNIVDGMTAGIEKLTTADDGDMSSSREEDTSSEKKCTSCEQNLEHTKTDNTSSNNDNVGQDKVQEDIVSNLEASDICANCGKQGAKNVCNKCKMVKYCNAACKKRHRSKHKKQCERRVAELHDIELFKQPPPEEDCPICFLRLPFLGTGRRYQSCCGKVLCSGCIHAMDKIDGGVSLCPFCRTPTPRSDDDIVKRLHKRMVVDDEKAVTLIGNHYSHGMHGLSRDYAKALELWHQAAELGSAEAYFSIGNAYYNGRGVEMDMKKAFQYWEIAAMKGCSYARCRLGIFDENAGNMERAIKNYMIAVGHGYNDSLNEIKQLYSNGKVTKNDYTKALQGYQKYLNEVKSSQRDAAAAYNEGYKYIE